MTQRKKNTDPAKIHTNSGLENLFVQKGFVTIGTFSWHKSEYLA